VKVAVLYQSLRGGTERAAHRIADGFRSRDCEVGVYPVTSFDAQFVLKSDLVAVGTWTDGLFGIGARPAQIGKLNALPSLAHRRAALFVTYEISPTRSLQGLSEWAEERELDVVASAGFKVRGPLRKDISDQVEGFVAEALAALQPA
jgi:hypothetical protein